MKKIILTFVVSIFILGNICCGNPFEKLSKKYENKKNITVVNVNRLGCFFLSGLSRFCPTEYHSFIKNSKTFNIIVCENADKVFIDDFAQYIKVDKFEELIHVSEDKNKVNIYVKEEKDLIKEVLLNVRSEKDVVIIRIVGKFDLEEVSKIWAKS